MVLLVINLEKIPKSLVNAVFHTYFRKAPPINAFGFFCYFFIFHDFDQFATHVDLCWSVLDSCWSLLTRVRLVLTYLDVCWYSWNRIDLIQKYCLEQLRKIMYRRETSSEKYSIGMKFTPGNDIVNQNNIALKFFFKYAYWLSIALYAIFLCSQPLDFISSNLNQNSSKYVTDQLFSCYKLKKYLYIIYIWNNWNNT